MSLSAPYALHSRGIAGTKSGPLPRTPRGPTSLHRIRTNPAAYDICTPFMSLWNLHTNAAHSICVRCVSLWLLQTVYGLGTMQMDQSHVRMDCERTRMDFARCI